MVEPPPVAPRPCASRSRISVSSATSAGFCPPRTSGNSLAGAPLAQLLAVPIALAAPLIVTRWGKGRTIIGGTLGMAFSLLLLALIVQFTRRGDSSTVDQMPA